MTKEDAWETHWDQVRYEHGDNISELREMFYAGWLARQRKDVNVCDMYCADDAAEEIALR